MVNVKYEQKTPLKSKKIKIKIHANHGLNKPAKLKHNCLKYRDLAGV